MEEKQVPLREEALNFFSKHFDPLLALKDKDLKPPVECEEESFFSKCAYLLHPKDPLYKKRIIPKKQVQQQQQQQRKEIIKNQKQQSQLSSSSSASSSSSSTTAITKTTTNDNDEKIKHPLISMTENYKVGPFSVVFNAMKGKEYVIVVTRNAREIRGTLTGKVEAFDRHLNLVLRDVEEKYFFKDEKQGKKEKTRFMHQILVRGDNIVSIRRKKKK